VRVPAKAAAPEALADHDDGRRVGGNRRPAAAYARRGAGILSNANRFAVALMPATFRDRRAYEVIRAALERGYAFE